MTRLFTARRFVSTIALVCVLFGSARPAAADARPAAADTDGAQILPISVACGVYSYFLSYVQFYSKAFAPIVGNSGTVYRCGIIGLDAVIIEEVIDPYHQQLTLDIYNTLNSIESVHNYFFEQEGISNFEYKARCDMTIESGCPLGAQFEIHFTLSAYTVEDFCLEEFCICQENWHCEEGLICRPFFDLPDSFGECVRAEWWFD